MKQSESKQSSQKYIPPNDITEGSLLDITYPYLKDSLLAQSKFFGFEVLVFLLAIHFAIIYTVTNYINRGYLLKWDVLLTVANNLAWDGMAVGSALLLALFQMYGTNLILKIPLKESSTKLLMYCYCALWMGVFVVGGLYLISVIDFYFTDRILIVVCSWTVPVKCASYCLDRLTACEKHSMLTKLKFIISPKVVYSEFVLDHNPFMKIHGSYLLIKSLTALMCLLINYILVTEIIAPYLQPSVFGNMSFGQLFFRLTPLLFFEHMCLYYLIMENILLAMAELTQLKQRRFYQDWWNAETIAEYFDKWVLLINAFSNHYLHLSRKAKHALHVSIIFLMLFSVFSQRVTEKMILFAGVNISIIFWLGQTKSIQNNYLVHLLTICFQPFFLAAALKYQIFK